MEEEIGNPSKQQSLSFPQKLRRVGVETNRQGNTVKLSLINFESFYRVQNYQDRKTSKR